MIDKSNGSIKINQLTINPNSSLEKLTESCNQYNIDYRIRDMKTGWTWIHLVNQEENNLFISLNIAFYETEIKLLMLTIDPEMTHLDMRENWSKENELKRQVFMEKWLDKEIGKKRRYTWGEVWCSFDPKSGFSSIGIRYKE
jgi:hypothetical protein